MLPQELGVGQTYETVWGHLETRNEGMEKTMDTIRIGFKCSGFRGLGF